jgi:hypothetical protein
MNDKLEENVEGTSGDLFQDNIPTVPRRTEENHRQPVRVLADIRTKHLQNISQKRYAYSPSHLSAKFIVL